MSAPPWAADTAARGPGSVLVIAGRNGWGPAELDSGAVPPRFGTCPPAERVTTKVFFLLPIVWSKLPGTGSDKSDRFDRLPIKIS